jgi:hypothetical protein
MERLENAKPNDSPDKTKVVRFEDLVRKLREKAAALARNPNYVKEKLNRVYKLLERLDQLHRKKMVRLDLEIPRELAKKLGSSKVLRVDGIIRQSVDTAIDSLLLEARPSGFKRLAQVKNISFMALDTLEAVIVDRRLEDIAEKVANIDAKLDAQNRGVLKSALDQMKELGMIRDPETKKNKLLFVQDRLNQCDHLFNELYQAKWQRYQFLKEKFESSTFSNKSELKEMCEIGEQLPAFLEPVLLCKVGQVKLYEMQQEFALAQDKAFEMAAFAAEKLEQFKDEFSLVSLENKNYKNITDFNPEKTLAALKDRLLHPNEHMEYLLNTILSFVLTVPEEVTESGKAGGGLKMKKSTRRNEMSMENHSVFDAPWSMSLKLLTALSLSIKIGVILIGFFIGPGETPLSLWWLPTVAIPGLILVVTSFFAINGYILTSDYLYVLRPGWKSKIELMVLESVEADPEAMKLSLQTWGISRFFPFCGRFRSKKLGNYLAYVTDPERSVILRFAAGQRHRTIVVSPGDPQRFVRELKHLRNI